MNPQSACYVHAQLTLGKILRTFYPPSRKSFENSCSSSSLRLSSHNLLSAIGGAFQPCLGGPKRLQRFIRDRFSTQHKQAHGLLITHRVTSAVELPPLTASKDSEAEGCSGLMKFFNSRVMGYCGPCNDYFSPLTGVLSEFAGVLLGSAEQQRAPCVFLRLTVYQHV